MVITGNGSSVHRLSVDCSLFNPARVQTAPSINLVATLAKLLPLGLFAVLAMMMFNSIPSSSTSPDLHFAYPCGNGEKHHADHPVGFHSCGGAGSSLRVRVINVMLAKRHCWRFSPLWAFTC
ncbi:hypothetical protein ACLK1S_10040 [Escherichia coli]